MVVYWMAPIFAGSSRFSSLGAVAAITVCTTGMAPVVSSCIFFNSACSASLGTNPITNKIVLTTATAITAGTSIRIGCFFGTIIIGSRAEVWLSDCLSVGVLIY